MRAFFSLFIFLSLLTMAYSSAVWAHGDDDCHDCVSAAELIDHEAFFFQILLKELVADLRKGQVHEALQVSHFDFEDPGFLVVFKTKLKRSPQFNAVVQKALQTYSAEVTAGTVPKFSEFQDVQRNRVMRTLHQLKSILGMGASQVAKFGILFGIGWATFELIEHSITPFLPFGLGFLCATFPVLWAVTIGPLVEPTEYFRTNPERVGIFRHALESIKLPFRRFRLNRSTQGVRHADLAFHRRRDQHIPDNAPALKALKASPFWFEAMYSEMKAKGVYGSGETESQKPFSLSDIFGSLEANRLSESQALQTFDLLSLPLKSLQSELDQLHHVKAINLFQFMKLKYRAGKMERSANKILRILLQIAHSKEQRFGADHSLALEEILKSYFNLLQDFNLKFTTSESQSISGIEIKSPEKKAPESFGERYKKLADRIGTVSKGRHICAEALAEI